METKKANQGTYRIVHCIPHNLTPRCNLVSPLWKIRDSPGPLLSAHILPTGLPQKLTVQCSEGALLTFCRWRLTSSLSITLPAALIISISSVFLIIFWLLHLVCKVGNSRGFADFFITSGSNPGPGISRWGRNICDINAHNKSHLPGCIKKCFHRRTSFSKWHSYFLPNKTF